MSTSDTWQTTQLGWTPPPPRLPALSGSELVVASLSLHWPALVGCRTPGAVLVGRLGLDPLNTAWRHRPADGVAFAVSPLRRRRIGMASLPPNLRDAGG